MREGTRFLYDMYSGGKYYEKIISIVLAGTMAFGLTACGVEKLPHHRQLQQRQQLRQQQSVKQQPKQLS